jgi:outer membrane immunogenic protein
VRKFILGAAATLALIVPASAADAPKGPVYKAAPAVFDWSGFYVGVDAGYMAARVDDALGGVLLASSRPDGFVGGVHLGYRRQLPNKLVWGVEVDLWGGDVDGFQLYPTTVNNSLIDINWGGSVRGVLGIAMSPTLLYVTGGAAFANIEGCVSVAFSTSTCATGFDFEKTRLGWTVGAGVAHAITPRAIVRLEYLFADYGSTNIVESGGAFTHVVDFQTHTVRAGLSWRFTTR